MTRQDFLLKWALYAVALIPLHLLEFSVFSRWDIFGAVPLLLPVAALCVALLEGPSGGAGYGLFTALVWSLSTPGSRGGVFVILTFLCFFTGLAAQRALNQNFFGALLCCLVGLGVWELFQVLGRLLNRSAGVPALLGIAAPELLVSLVFVLIVYPLFRAVYGKVGGTRLAD